MTPTDKLFLSTINKMKEGELYKLSPEAWNQTDKFYKEKGWTQLQRLEGFKKEKNFLILYWNNKELYKINYTSQENLTLTLTLTLAFALSFALSFGNGQLVDSKGKPLTRIKKKVIKPIPLIDLS